MDDMQRITYWPAKKDNKIKVLEMLASKFEQGRLYTEKEVNTILSAWHTFDDFYLLRRELINNWFMSRTSSGSRYWVEESTSHAETAAFLMQNYTIGSVKSLMRLKSGYGSDCFYVQTDSGEFIFKVFDIGMQKYAINEAELLKHLNNHGIPISKIIPATNGESLLSHHSSPCHLQQFISGPTYRRGTAPEWLLYESGRMLGRVQKVLESFPSLPIGMGQSFFDTMTPEKAMANYEGTLKLAADRGDDAIADAIHEKIRMLCRFTAYPFNLAELTCKNTHGDFKVQQLICGKDAINAVIDFSGACILPINWEVIRSYSLADPACEDGEINIEHLKKYISCFLEFGSLSAPDLQTMPYLYYYQLLVSDFFGQYYTMSHQNKHLLLEDAFHSQRLCRWFERNLTRLSSELEHAF